MTTPEDLTSEMTPDEEGIVTLTDENGNSVDCFVMSIMEVDGANYALLAPCDGPEDADEIEMFIYTYAEEGDMEVFGIVPDDEYARVCEVFRQFMEYGEDEEDEEDEEE